MKPIYALHLWLLCLVAVEYAGNSYALLNSERIIYKKKLKPQSGLEHRSAAQPLTEQT